MVALAGVTAAEKEHLTEDEDETAINKQREGRVPHGDGEPGNQRETSSSSQCLGCRRSQDADGASPGGTSLQPLLVLICFSRSWASIPCCIGSSLKAEKVLFIFVSPQA